MNFGQSFLNCAFAFGDDANRAAQVFDFFLCEARALQANGIQGSGDRILSLRHCKRHDVFIDGAVTGYERILTYRDKLIEAADAPDAHEILDRDMSGEVGRIGDGDVAAQCAVMRDMHISHEQVVIPDPGDSAASHRTHVHCDKLAEHVSFTHLEVSLLTFEL